MIGVAVLGSTGSIGVNTLDVLARHPDRYQVVALGAHRNAAKLAEQMRALQPLYAALADAQAARDLSARLQAQALPRGCCPGRGAHRDLPRCPRSTA